MTSAVFKKWKFDSAITSLAVNRNGDWVLAALADGTARVLPAAGDADKPVEIKIHDGISLSLKADADAHAFLSGGDDGKVVVIDPKLASADVIANHKGQWVDHIAGSPDGKYRAYSCGKKLHILDDEGKAKFAEPLILPSSPGDIAFSPNGKRLAASHYNGVSVWWTNAKETAPTKFEWKGSHLSICWSPDSKTVMTAMQENALHGWQLSDGKEMRMQGYASKIHSLNFTARGKYLATSGADQIICWPFSGGGPWGKPPLTLGGTDNRTVTMVASHPKDEMVAAGYSDGMIVLAPLDGRMEVMINAPLAAEGAAINGLVWNTEGDALFASVESGTLFLFTIESVRKAVVHSG